MTDLLTTRAEALQRMGEVCRLLFTWEGRPEGVAAAARWRARLEWEYGQAEKACARGLDAPGEGAR